MTTVGEANDLAPFCTWIEGEVERSSEHALGLGKSVGFVNGVSIAGFLCIAAAGLSKLVTDVLYPGAIVAGIALLVYALCLNVKHQRFTRRSLATFKAELHASAEAYERSVREAA
jgi:hypothetical protein